MKYSKKYKSLIIFVLFSILFLMVYDLFNEVEKRGEVTEARNLPRFYRLLLLILSGWFYFLIGKIKKSKFNRQLIFIYGLIILHIFFNYSIGFNFFISLSKLLYLLFVYLFFFKFYDAFINKDTIRYLNLFVAISVIILSGHIIASRFGLLSSDIAVKVYGDNNSYILLAFLPLIYFNKKIKIKRLLIILLILGVFLSLKRGAMVALLVCLLVTYFLERRILSRKGIVEKIKRFFIFISVITLVFLLYSEFSVSFIDRFEDLSSDGSSFGSGRGNIYSLIWSDWYNSNDIITYLLGNGYNSVQVLTKNTTGSALMAHSDILNFVHSYGLLGISLLLAFLINQIKTIRKLYTIKNKLVIPYFLLFIILICKVIYSGNFESPSFVFLLIGYAIVNTSLTNFKTRQQ